jgi:peptidoglycan-associated lipoprotein
MRWTLILLPVFAVGCHRQQAAVQSVDTTLSATTIPIRQSARAEAVEQIKANFNRVHFDYDSSRLDDTTKRALSANAAILQRFPDIEVEVQGHCDERGTTEYNLALGDRRAAEARRYLSLQGVGADRLHDVSYGEERPAVVGHSEADWAENRRVDFRVVVPDPVAQIDGSVR